MALKAWVRLPTEWIAEGGLKNFRWEQARGSDNAAALMLLIVIAHRADEDDGMAKLTYDQLATTTNLSRAKVSGGLAVLVGLKIIEREPEGRSTYKLARYRKMGGWGKLPAAPLYSHGYVTAFAEFKLRKSSELNALKLYLLFVRFRDDKTNMANISYDKITEHTGIERHHIKSGLSVLAANGLVHVEHVPSNLSAFGISNAYRLANLEPYKHMGTTGRGMEALDFAGEGLFSSPGRKEKPIPF